MAATIAVVTADLVGSRRLAAPERRLVDRRLRDVFAKNAFQKYRSKAKPGGFDFRVTVGDEFQFVLEDKAVLLDAVTELRLFLALVEIPSGVSFRAGIGIGTVTLARASRAYERDGPAFVRSREALEGLKRSQRTAIRSGDASLDRTLDVLLGLMDEIQRRWTREQWHAIDFELRNRTILEAASALRVAHQNISKRLQAAGWREFDVALDYIREALRTL